jgi:hypothetical protein
MENNNEIILRKIPLKIFLDVLTKAWNDGADYIDIIGIPNEVQDNIGIAISPDYYSKGDDNDPEEDYDVEVDLDPNKPLEDDDLNQLI